MPVSPSLPSSPFLRQQIEALQTENKALREYAASVRKLAEEAPLRWLDALIPVLTNCLESIGTIPHKQAVAMFRLNDPTAKEESKFMATIRKQFGVGIQKNKRV